MTNAYSESKKYTEDGFSISKLRTSQENYKKWTVGYETEYDIVFNFVELAKSSVGTIGKRENVNAKTCCDLE